RFSSLDTRTLSMYAISLHDALAILRIGVTLAVTPRILDDGRIMLDIWPVISSQSGEDRYEVAGNEFVNPRIALNELSTEVITEKIGRAHSELQSRENIVCRLLLEKK